MHYQPAPNLHVLWVCGGVVVSLLVFSILIGLAAFPANLLVITSVVNAAIRASQELG